MSDDSVMYFFNLAMLTGTALKITAFNVTARCDISNGGEGRGVFANILIFMEGLGPIRLFFTVGVLLLSLFSLNLLI
ncbi:MAG: hypothetical protein HQK53_09000 [Oligoflexia bacterium]|nr:hypothetical protein [Oligoflexia bacterium]